MTLQQEINERNRLVLLLVPDIEEGLSYDKMMNFLVGSDLIKAFQKKRKICYITLYKSYDFLLRYFQRRKIETEDIFFIDCVTAFIREPSKVRNCEFVNAPYDLAQMSEAIKKCLAKGYDFLIFDSLSALVAYGPVVSGGTGVLRRFVKSFMPHNKGVTVVFICSKSDLRKFVVEEALPIFDKILRYDCNCKNQHYCGKELGGRRNGKI